MARKNTNRNPLTLPPVVSRSAPILPTDEVPTAPVAPIVVRPTAQADVQVSPLQIPINPQRGAGIMPPTVSRPATNDFPMSPERAARMQTITNGTIPSSTPTAAADVPPDVSAYARRQAELDAAREKLSQPVTESEDSRLHSGLEAIGKGLEAFNPRFGMVRNWDELFARLGAVPGAFIGGMVNDKWDEQEAQQRGLAKNQQEQEQLNQSEKNRLEMQQKQSDIDYKNAQTSYQQQRPDLEMEKITGRAKLAEQNNLMRQYNALADYNENDPDDRAFGDAFQERFGYRPMSKNAKTKTQQIVDNRDGQVYVLQTDEQGGSKISRLTNDDGSAFKITSNQMLASGDKKEQRELQRLLQNSRNVTALNVAKIGANSRETVANITQQGANNRQQISVQATQKLAEYKTLVDKEKSETNFARKQQLQTQREEAAKELKILRDQLEGK